MLRRFTALLLAAALCAGLAACEKQPLAQVTAPPATQPAVTVDTAEMFTHRDLDGSYENAVQVTLSDDGSTADGSGIAVEGNVITVTAEGTYRFTGKLTEGQIRVAAGEQDKVQLVFSGVSGGENRSRGAVYFVLRQGVCHAGGGDRKRTGILR